MDKQAFQAFCNDIVTGQHEAELDVTFVAELKQHDPEVAELFDGIRTGYLALCTCIKSRTEKERTGTL